MKDIREGIAKELHRPARKRFATRKTVLKGIHDLYQADIVDMSAYARENGNFKYILTLINCFTKVAHAIPLKRKTGTDVAKSMGPFLKKHSMRNFQTDHGNEFYNLNLQKLLKRYSINHYSTYSDKKAAIVERFNRTLKSIMWRAFTVQGSHKWVKMLPDLIKKYNNTFHRSLGMKPVEVNARNENKVKHRLNAVDSSPFKKRFSVGDKVRISKYKKVFTKGYLPNWTNEVFTIHKVQSTVPVTYLLSDSRGEIVKGGFYEYELAKTKFDDVFFVEKVLRRKGDKMLVRWLGYDKSHDTWIDRKEII
jgi:hypothetical protein